jgi:hypothetical protein
MRTALTKLGFEVIFGEDLDQQGLAAHRWPIRRDRR